MWVKMNALDSISSKLKAIGLYSLNGSTRVDAELAAYAEGFTLISDSIEELEREVFIPTAIDYGLTLREQAFGPQKTDLPVEDRRSMLLYRGAVTVNDYTRESMERAMIAAGVKTSMSEKIPEKKLYINYIAALGGYRTPEQIIAAANEFLPAHLVCEFDFGSLTWNFLDASENTFDAIDKLDYTWDQIDSHT